MKEDDKQHCRIVLGCVDCLVATGGKDLVVTVGMVDENMVWASGHAGLWWDVTNKIEQAILGKVCHCRGATGVSVKHPFHPRCVVVAPSVGFFIHFVGGDEYTDCHIAELTWCIVNFTFMAPEITDFDYVFYLGCDR